MIKNIIDTNKKKGESPLYGGSLFQSYERPKNIPLILLSSTDTPFHIKLPCENTFLTTKESVKIFRWKDYCFECEKFKECEYILKNSVYDGNSIFNGGNNDKK